MSANKLSALYTRISPQTYLEGLCGVYASKLFAETRTVDDFIKVLTREFMSYVSLRESKDYISSDLVAVYLQMATFGISVSHRMLMHALAPGFNVEVKEFRTHTTRNARVFDLYGNKQDVLGLLALFTYSVLFYDGFTRRWIDSMRCPRYDKHLARKDFNSRLDARIRSAISDVISR